MDDTPFLTENELLESNIPQPGYGHTLTAALKILNDNSHPVDALPISESDPTWKDIKEGYKLTLPQLIALKNYVRFLTWTVKRQVDTLMIDEDFSSSPARDLQGCLSGLSDDITVADAILGSGSSDDCCLFNLLISDLVTTAVDVTRERLEYMIKVHTQWLHENQEKLPDIPFEFKLILRLYTIKEPVPLYKFVNAVLNSKDREAAGLRFIKRFVKLLLLAAKAMQSAGFEVTAEAFRGLTVENNCVLQRKCDAAKTVFSKGSLMTLAGFTSVTTDPGVAGEFGDRLFFHFVNVRGVRLDVFSFYSNEQEILVLPPAVFSVVDLCFRESKITVTLNHAHQESASYLQVGRPVVSEVNGSPAVSPVGEGYKEVLYKLYLKVHCGDREAWQELFQAATERNISLAQAMVCVCYSASRVSIVPQDGEMAKKFGEQSLSWMFDASNRHCHFAKTFLAALTFHGIVSSLTPPEAVKQLTIVVKANAFVEAEYYLFLCHHLGFGLVSDLEEEIRFLLTAASKSHPPSQFQIGYRYAQGKGVEKDVNEAVRWYRLAADQNFAAAQVNLGSCYEHGVGVEKDVDEAVRLYRLAADQNDEFAQTRLGRCYERGIGVEKDTVEAVRLYRLNADQKFAHAQTRLGMCFQYGIGVDKDVFEAVHWYRLAADQKDPHAQTLLGMCHECGVGVDKNIAEAVRWYRLAVDQKDPHAQSRLGICYEYGAGVRKLVGEAVSLYRMAADQNDALAQTRLGMCYEYGTGVSKIFVEAVRWYRLAADQNDAYALTRLGMCYQGGGEGVRKNLVEAARCYQLAVDKNFAEAQRNLGSCYFHGVGVEKNVQEAVRLFQLAAAQNDAAAMTNLGSCYELGKGVEKDIAEAFRWYQLAAALNNETAQVNLGSCYDRGVGTVKNADRALRLYELAANKGLAAGQVSLGYCFEQGIGGGKMDRAAALYSLAADQNFTTGMVFWGSCLERGVGVAKNVVEAVRFYRLAADLHDALAQTYVGRCYERGVGLDKNVVVAVVWYQFAADQNFAAAQNQLGICYQRGNGIEKDEVAAVLLYRLAANQNDAAAQTNLGLCLESGIGVDKDEVEAVRFYRLAADQKFSAAQIQLGKCFENGIGVEKDATEAMRWYRLAADQQNIGTAHSDSNLCSAESTISTHSSCFNQPITFDSNLLQTPCIALMIGEGHPFPEDVAALLGNVPSPTLRNHSSKRH